MVPAMRTDGRVYIVVHLRIEIPPLVLFSASRHQRFALCVSMGHIYLNGGHVLLLPVVNSTYFNLATLHKLHHSRFKKYIN